jgi:filamentous hemagglutinin family protein
MNLSFRVIWSKCRLEWIAVAETVKSSRKKSSTSLLENKIVVCPIKLSSLFIAVFTPFALFAEGLKDPIVRSGSVSIDLSNSQNSKITQQSQKAIIDWRKFSVDKSSTVEFKHPNTSSITLNRVLGNSASIIDGTISANGQIWILNNSGVLIGESGKINAHGFMATTQSITNQNFLDGKYKFNSTNNNSGELINAGKIDINDGYAILVGKTIVNTGHIQARLGHITLGSAKSFTIDLVGDKLLSFAIADWGDSEISSKITNSGEISSLYGTILLTEKNAKKVINDVINSTGVIEADTVKIENGKVVFASSNDKHISVRSAFSEPGHEERFAAQQEAVIQQEEAFAQQEAVAQQQQEEAFAQEEVAAQQQQEEAFAQEEVAAQQQEEEEEEEEDSNAEKVFKGGDNDNQLAILDNVDGRINDGSEIFINNEGAGFDVVDGRLNDGSEIFINNEGAGFDVVDGRLNDGSEIYQQ